MYSSYDHSKKKRRVIVFFSLFHVHYCITSNYFDSVFLFLIIHHYYFHLSITFLTFCLHPNCNLIRQNDDAAAFIFKVINNTWLKKKYKRFRKKETNAIYFYLFCRFKHNFIFVNCFRYRKYGFDSTPIFVFTSTLDHSFTN